MAAYKVGTYSSSGHEMSRRSSASTPQQRLCPVVEGLLSCLRAGEDGSWCQVSPVAVGTQVTWLEEVVRDEVELSQFTIGDHRPRDVPTQILAGVQGALLVGRLSSDRHVLAVVAEGIRRCLGYLPKERIDLLRMHAGSRQCGALKACDLTEGTQ